MVKSYLVTRKPHFIKPIISNSSHKLSIPKAFLKHIRGGKAVLRSYGKCWHVKIDEGVSFQEGWKEFANDNALSVGDFLMFKHQGNMVFDVIIFGKSACEKKYTCFAGEDKKSNDEDLAKYLKKTMHLNKRCGMYSHRQGAAGAASSYTTQRPHFKAIIVPSNLFLKRQYLNIPLIFSKLNGFNRKCYLTLKDPEGRSWPVKLGHGKNDRTFMACGWNQFQLSNNLREGDECIFELISPKKNKRPVLSVLIFRCS